MNTDIRLDVKFFDHLKTRKLEARLGPSGVLCLIHLWCWAGVNRPSGVLSGVSGEDIEIISGWALQSPSQSGSFVEALLELHWLEQDSVSQCYLLHDWRAFQQWAAYDDERAASGRLRALARRNRRAYDMARADGKKGLTQQEYAEYLNLAYLDLVTTPDGLRHSADHLSNAPTPAPSPNPNPNPAPSPRPNNTLRREPARPREKKEPNPQQLENLRRLGELVAKIGGKS